MARAEITLRRRRRHQDLQSRQGLGQGGGCEVPGLPRGAHPNFDRSPHAKANVSCLACHNIHGSKEEPLLKASQPTLCFQCHTDVKPQFDMPFHHKVNEGAVKCSDCHDVHGTFGKNNLRSTADSEPAICTKCHTETRGPFVYEHAPSRPRVAWGATRRMDRRTRGC
jgi:DmsE family decaheme c-type cytochrome